MNSTPKKLTLFAGLCLLLLLTNGCFDTKEDFTINPDGSGKVVHECTFQTVNLGDQKPDPDQALRDAVREVLEQSKGVEAWRNVSFKTLDDGRLFFRGTAYFKDLSRLEIHNQTMLEFGWKKTADGGAILDLRTNKSDTLAGGTLPDGGMMEVTAAKKTQPAATNKLSPEELSKKIRQERAQFQQTKPMLAGFLGNLKQTAVFHLPGKIVSSSNFAKDASGALMLKFEGAKLLAVMEKLINDDEWCRKNGGTGFDNLQDKPMMDDEINQLVFGEKAPVRATIASGTAPLFNYATEVAAAKTDYAKTQKELGVGADSSGSTEPAAPPAQGGALKNVKVVGIRLVTQSDQKRNLRPFNYDTEYSLALLVEFPGSVQSVSEESAVETALADDGSSLLPDSEWNRKVHFPQLSTDKTAAILEFKLKVPGNGVKGLKELSGRLHYNVSSGAREVDLGFEDLKAGAAGTELGARIESIKDGWQKDGSQMMDLRLNTNPDGIKSLSLVVDGTKTALRQNGYGGGGNSYTFTYESKPAFPAKGRLVAEVYDKLQAFEAPFKLENVTLLGASMKSE
jgi:hypothetical protein